MEQSENRDVCITIEALACFSAALLRTVAAGAARGAAKRERNEETIRINERNEGINMKKFIALLLAALLLLTLAACAKDQTDGSDQAATEASNVLPTVAPTGAEQESQPDAPAEPATDPASAQNHSPAEIEAAIANALGEGYLCTVDVPEDELFASVIGEIDLTRVKSWVAKQTTVPSLHIDSVVVAECEPDYAGEAVKLIIDRYAQTLDYARLYSFGVPKAEGARLYRVGDTVIFVVAGADPEDGADEAKAAELAEFEYKKVDAAIAELFGEVPENLMIIPEA